ncbi:IS5 family transposase, partial [Streptomyces prasinus]
MQHAFPQVGPERHLLAHAAGHPGREGRGRGHPVADAGRLHHRAGPSARRRRQKGAVDRDEAGDHALGRSRGGLSTKVHLVCDGLGRPLGFVLSGGNANDCTRFEQGMGSISVPRVGPGRLRTRPDRVVADKGYSSRKIRSYLRRHGIPDTISERVDQALGRLNRGTRGGRPPGFDRSVYRRRNVVERCFNRLKHWRGLATRYDKTRESYQAAV